MAKTNYLSIIAVDLGERRFLSSGRLLWLRSIGWMIALIFGVALAFGPSGELLSRMLPKDPAYQFLGHLLSSLLILATYALLVRLGEDRTPSEVSLTAAPAGLLTGMAMGVLTFSAVMAILIGFHLYDVTYDGPASAWRGASLAIEAGVLEEVLVRGIILRLAWRAFGPWAALAISALLFGAGHIPNPGATAFTTVSIAIEAGIMLAAFYALTGRLWLSIGFHAAWNFTQGYLYGASVSGGDFGGALFRSSPRTGLPDWLTGGAFGPEASLPAVMICTFVGAATLWFAWRQGNLGARPV